MTRPLRAAYYGRVSTADQVEGTSLDTQRARCLSTIEAHGWGLVGEYVDEGVSGAKGTRPALDRLMADCRAKEVEAIVVSKLDRFGRSVRHLANLLGELDDLGVTFLSVAESFDSSTPAGRLQRNMLGSFAEFERDQIRERTSSGKLAVARDGYWVGGPAPFGFRTVPAGRHKKLEIEEPEAEIIREAARLVLDGGLSVYMAAKTLNAMGAKPRHAASWKEANLKRLLRSPTIAGRSQIAARNRGWHLRVEMSAEALEVPAILSSATFEALQSALDARHKGPRTTVVPFYLLSQGILHGACGARMHGYHRTERETIWYRCQRRRPGIEDRCNCRQVRSQDVDRVVWQKVYELLSDPSQLMSLAAEYFETRSEQMVSERDNFSTLQQREAALELAKTERVAAALKAGLDPSVLKSAVEQIDDELGLVQRRLRQVAHWRDANASKTTEMQRIVDLAEYAHARLDSLSEPEKREILLALGLKVTVLSWETCELCQGKGRIKGLEKGPCICPRCLSSRRTPRVLIEGTWSSEVLLATAEEARLSEEVPSTR